MNATDTTTRFASLTAACAVTLALLLGVGSMSRPNAAEAWVAKAPVAAAQS